MDWFDGYDGQDTAIFDDFRASGNRFSYILRLIDRYPMDVPVKGGFVYWNPGTLYSPAQEHHQKSLSTEKQVSITKI